MFEINGKSYSIEQLQDAANRQGVDFGLYLEKMKEQGLVEKQVGLPQDPTASQEDMGSQLDDGSSESVSWFDQTWFGRGFRAASTTGEATDLMAENFSNVDIEKVRDFIAAKEDEAKNYVPSERMQKFQKQYVKEGKTWSAFFRGVKNQPGLLPELFVQSLGTQVGTAFDAPESLAAAGTGAIAGAAIGAAPGAIAGAMGGLATSMEAALTFGELIEKELKLEGKEFTDENIKALLEGPKGQKIRNRSIGRGLAIGSIEGLTGGLAGKVAATTKQVVKGARKSTLAAATTGTTVEAVGGGAGEVAGRVAAGQDMDAAEIGFEAITGTVTAPVNVGYALATAKAPVYKINGETVTYEQVKDFVDTADDVDVATADIQMENDFTGLGKKATAKQEAARAGIALSGDVETIGLVDEAIAEKDYKANMEFAKKHSKLYGLDFTELTQEQMEQRFPDKTSKELSETPGTILDSEIVINKDAAKKKLYGDNAGNHELLHGIIKASGQKGRITDKTISEFLNIIGEENAGLIQKRIDENYGQDYMSEHRDEYFTIFSDLIANEEVKFNDSVFTKIQDFVRRLFANLGLADVDFTSGKGAYNFLKDYNKSIHKGALSKGVTKATKGDVTFDEAQFSRVYQEVEALKEDLIDPETKESTAFIAADTLKNEVDRILPTIEGITKEDRADIVQNFVTSERGLFGLLKKYNPNRNDSIMGYLNSTTPAGKLLQARLQEFYKDNPRFGNIFQTTTDEAVASKVEKQTAIIDTDSSQQAEQKRTKIDILDFAETRKVSDKIKSTVKVKEGDNFKDISSKYAGKVGEMIFNVPAKKIMEGGANLVPTTKVKEGMALPSEALNIQRVFSAEQNLSNFVKTLPLYNVSEPTAEINKAGESIDVSRDTYGIAIGLKGLPLDYFYEDFTDPSGVMTSPSGRSRGLKSQTPVKKLKQKFVNPTKEVVDQLKKDIGITPAGQQNLYDRNIGQLLKGLAKVYSINASLSAAQRNQEAKLKDATPQEAKAIKQQTADITAAQSKAAFSKSVKDVISIKSLFELETKGIDKLLNSLGVDPTFKLTKEEGREGFIKAIQEELLPLMPRAFWFGPDSTVFTASNKTYGLSMSTTDGKRKNKNNEYKKPEEAKAYNDFRDRLKALSKLPDSSFGKPIIVDGKEIDFSISSYDTMFSDVAKIKKKIKNGDIKAWNEKVGLIHREMWSRFNKAINKGGQVNSKTAAAIGTYLKLVGSDTNHWHKLGAQFAGYSKAITGTRFEYEHAMPATAAYLYLMDAAIGDSNFKASYDLVIENYKLISLDKAMDKKLTSVGLQRRMPVGWDLIENNWWNRYFNSDVSKVSGGISPNSLITIDGKTFGQEFQVNAEGKSIALKDNASRTVKFSKAITNARSSSSETKSRGMSTFDFDETLIIDGKNFVTATKGDDVVKIPSDKWPIDGPTYAQEGYTFDFSDFANVRGGKQGPLLQKMKNQIRKYGPSNVFVLTARMQEAAGPIHKWLQSQGINIPLENITGLGRSEGDAKAQWFVEKYAEGYNDMYFVDDALPNVKAVKHVFDQLDIKGKSVQAKMQFSKSMDDRFNSILEEVKNIDANKRFSESKARKRGKGEGRFRYFIPPSHEDFVGLLYNFMGKGKRGNQHRDFFEKSLIQPLNRAYRELNSAKQAISNDYKALLKQYPGMRKRLTTKTPDGDYLLSDAVRVYLWSKFDLDIPGMTKTDKADLARVVLNDKDLLTFAESLAVISRVEEGYVKPGESWEIGDITTDLQDATGRVGRGKFFQEFIENADIIFSTENLNKIEAAYGTNFREALEDVLYRTKNGTNRPTGKNRLVNRFLDYINGSVGATMFFNSRSAVLQQLSMVNFLNYGDNNIFKAAVAFGNQKQFWADYVTIFNSDMLKQRRAGRAFDLNANEIAAQVSKSKQPIRALIKYLLNLGFTPTQLADSNAIALGGATFYRNRIKTYLSQGLSEQEAQAKAFDDFQEIAEATQQSARPDMLSQQQASPLGRVILAFQNTPSQYARLIKKAGLDLINRRKAPGYTTQWQSDMSNISRIMYYTAVQNAIFYTLQTGLFAMMFSDDPQDEEFFAKKRDRILNGTIDSILRGSGVGGAVISTIKNAAIKMHEQNKLESWQKEDNALMMELLQLSPPIGIKARKLRSAERELIFNAKEIEETSLLDINNPIYTAGALAVEATTNLPTARAQTKSQNIEDAMNNEFTWWQRLAMGLGWSKWNLGATEKELEVEKKRSRRSSRGRGGRSRSR